MTALPRALSAAGVATGLALLVWCSARVPPPPPQPSLPPLSELLDCTAPGYARPVSGRRPQVPADHAAHPRFCGEAWQLGGVLTAGGRRFGFRFALWRAALRPEPPTDTRSAWATNQVYRGLLVLGERRFERYSRGALGLAGSRSTADAVTLWLDDWRLILDNAGARLEAGQDDVTARLRLNAEKPIVAAGGGPLSGYLWPRLTASGSLNLVGERLPVRGQAWLQHGWGSLVPPAGGQLVLDRLLLQLADGRELALTARRRRGGGPLLADGLLIDASGKTRRLRRRDLSLTELEHGRSPDGSGYPIRWRLEVPRYEVRLDLAAVRPTQGLDLGVSLWSGLLELDDGGQGWAELGRRGGGT